MDYLYKGSTLGTVITVSNSITIVEGGLRIVALRSMRSGRCEIMNAGTDQQGSILSWQGSRSCHAYQNFTAYGYSRFLHINVAGYHGVARDKLTGHYHFGHGYRQLNPVLMRFNSADALSPFGAGGLNAYAFLLNDPVNGTDPSGAYKIGGRALVSTDDFVLFVTQPAPRMPRVLNAVAHARPGTIKIGGVRYTPERYVDYLKGLKIDPAEFDHRIIGCGTADSPGAGQPAFIEGLSGIVKRPVEGNSGLATYKLERTLNPMSREVHVTLEVPEVNPFEVGTEKHAKFNYSPVTVGAMADIRSKK
ncbi:RHS repeat-associated core domain-containing protein [Pseudomonas asiatica]|uniref:RHS repeat-associated core domain-containing protein n=1 Tax=Pseudomonas asiatica TaxID=2219225 RepID=UPI00399ADACE